MLLLFMNKSITGYLTLLTLFNSMEEHRPPRTTQHTDVVTKQPIEAIHKFDQLSAQFCQLELQSERNLLSVQY